MLYANALGYTGRRFGRQLSMQQISLDRKRKMKIQAFKLTD